MRPERFLEGRMMAAKKAKLMGKAEGLKELSHWIRARHARQPLRLLEDLLIEIEIRVQKLEQEIESDAA